MKKSSRSSSRKAGRAASNVAGKAASKKPGKSGSGKAGKPKKSGKAPASARTKRIMRHSREGVKSQGKKPARKPAAGGQAKTPDRKRQYLDAYRRELPTTLRVMRALPPDAADFQPHERSGTAVRVVHTFAFENMALVRITTQDLQFPPNFPPAPATLEEAIENYERGASEVIAAVEAMPDSRLSETVTFFVGPGKMGQVPVIDVFWFMLMDSIHHRGQLSVYVRLAGGKVPSIYGPTADEPWR